MAQDAGRGPLVGAVILALALLGAAWMVSGSVDRSTAQLNGIKLALAETQKALQKVAQAPAAAPAAAPARSARPDPNRRYKVNTAGSPAKGPDSAKAKKVHRVNGMSAI